LNGRRKSWLAHWISKQSFERVEDEDGKNERGGIAGILESSIVATQRQARQGLYCGHDVINSQVLSGILSPVPLKGCSTVRRRRRCQWEASAARILSKLPSMSEASSFIILQGVHWEDEKQNSVCDCVVLCTSPPRFVQTNRFQPLLV
jgi:hypothetical protein